VLDKRRGIYKNRERGIFTYDLASNPYDKAPVEYLPPAAGRKELLILDFGDTFFIDWFMRAKALRPAIDAIGYGNPDTLYAMIMYYAVCSASNCHAQSWWEGSYARILYPNANLSSQRISDFLTAIWDEYSQREFFQEYFTLLDRSGSGAENVLIDRTGLPNSIRFPLTAVKNHNGEVSNEVRLVYVVQQKTGLPLYFRYCPGNVIDTMTLIRSLEELKAQGINVKFAILDAGYYTEDNIHDFYDNKVSFITRLKGNLTIYKDLIGKNYAEMLPLRVQTEETFRGRLLLTFIVTVLMK